MTVATVQIDSEERLAELCKALAHPVRLRILRFLLASDACRCGDIVDELPLAQSTISEHLRILKQAGLIRGSIDGKRVCYCADRICLRELRERFAMFFPDGPETDNPQCR